MVRGDMNYAGRLVSVCEMEMVRADLPVGRQARTMENGLRWKDLQLSGGVCFPLFFCFFQFFDLLVEQVNSHQNV